MFRFVRNINYIDNDDLSQVHDVYQNSDYYQIVMQRCYGITLYNLIEINKYIEEDSARVLYKQVAIYYTLYLTMPKY